MTRRVGLDGDYPFPPAHSGLEPAGRCGGAELVGDAGEGPFRKVRVPPTADSPCCTSQEMCTNIMALIILNILSAQIWCGTVDVAQWNRAMFRKDASLVSDKILHRYREHHCQCAVCRDAPRILAALGLAEVSGRDRRRRQCSLRHAVLLTPDSNRTLAREQALRFRGRIAVRDRRVASDRGDISVPLSLIHILSLSVPRRMNLGGSAYR